MQDHWRDSAYLHWRRFGAARGVGVEREAFGAMVQFPDSTLRRLRKHRSPGDSSRRKTPAPSARAKLGSTERFDLMIPKFAESIASIAIFRGFATGAGYR